MQSLSGNQNPGLRNLCLKEPPLVQFSQFADCATQRFSGLRALVSVFARYSRVIRSNAATSTQHKRWSEDWVRHPG